MDKVNKRISSNEFVAIEEILKGMPDFYKKIYFPSFYINEYNDSIDVYHDSMVVLAKRRDLNYLRGVVQKNFLYDKSLDSLEYKEEDYGFSFFIHNLKFVVGAVVKEEDSTIIKLFDTKDKEGITYDYSDPTNLFGLFTNEVEQDIKICNIDIDNFKENAKRDIRIEEPSAIEDTSGKISTIGLILLIVIAIITNIIVYLYLH